jgi:multisubunit Na+/H+ antiporter MnhC subunit
MLLRKWTTDTPTPRIVRLEARRFANEITLSVDGVVVHCRVAPFGVIVPFRRELMIDGASWMVLVGMGFWGRGCEFVRTREAQQAIRRWRRNDALLRIGLASLLVFLAFSRLPAAISSRLHLKEQFENLPSQVLLAIGLFGVAVNLFSWCLAARRTQVSSAMSPPPQKPKAENDVRSVVWCFVLLAISIVLSIAAFNVKPIALYFVGNREMVPVLTAVLAGLAAVVFGVAVTIALNPMSKAESRDENRSRAALLRRETTLGTRPRSSSFFRPLLEDIRSTARRWKLGLPRFWIGRVRADR